jgi:hypothetical protein
MICNVIIKKERNYQILNLGSGVTHTLQTISEIVQIEYKKIFNKNIKIFNNYDQKKIAVPVNDFLYSVDKIKKLNCYESTNTNKKINELLLYCKLRYA